MEKNQKETGITLSFLRSEAIHCTRKRLKKKACPRKPIDSQNCSVVMIGASLDQQLESGHAKVPRACGPHFTLPETTRSGKNFSSSRRLSGARFLQGVANGFAKCFDWLGTDQWLAIDEEGRGARELQGATLAHVGLDFFPELMRVEAGREGLAIETEAARVAHEIVAGEVRHGEIEQIVILPEYPLGGGTARRLRGREGALVAWHGVVLVDEADLAFELLHDLPERLLGALAGRTLEVGKLHDGDEGVGGTAGKRRVDVGARGFIGGGRRPEEHCAQCAGKGKPIMVSRHDGQYTPARRTANSSRNGGVDGLPAAGRRERARHHARGLHR